MISYIFILTFSTLSENEDLVFHNGTLECLDGCCLEFVYRFVSIYQISTQSNINTVIK